MLTLPTFRWMWLGGVGRDVGPPGFFPLEANLTPRGMAHFFGGLLFGGWWCAEESWSGNTYLGPSISTHILVFRPMCLKRWFVVVWCVVGVKSLSKLHKVLQVFLITFFTL